jgi:hypothetical protein
MWWEEQDVESTIEDFLISTDWQTKEKPGRVRVDLFMEKELEGDIYSLIMEVKGDVRNPQYDAAAYRNKYMQIIMGQLLCRTGQEQLGYDDRTILGVTFPDPCKDGRHYFLDYVNGRVARELRDVLRLCVFTINEDYEIHRYIPRTVPEDLFVSQ